MGLIDFDDAYVGVQLFDLALVLMEFAVVQEGEFAVPLAGAVLRGYSSVRRLGQAEASSLYDAMRFVCFKFLAYTVDLLDYRGAAAVQNPYLRRLDMFRGSELRARFDALLPVGGVL